MNSPQSIPETFSSLGSWNPDATESSIPKGDLLEALNFRKARPDEYETRSGILIKSCPGNKYPGSIAEYRLDNTYVVALFYEESGSLNCKIVSNDLSSSAINVDINGIVTGGHGYEVMACQFNTFLLVTVFGYGVFALGPKANLDKDGNPTTDVNLAVSSDLTVWNAPIELGKQLTPSPADLTYLDQVSGDLIVYQYIVPPPNGGTDCKGQYNTSGTSAEPIKIRVAMGAPYFRVGADTANGINIRKTNLAKQFEFEKGDLINGATGTSDGSPHLSSDRDPSGPDHLQKRGWFYRFIMKSKFKDAKGQEFTYFHEPSADIYVPDNDYAPPFVCADDAGVFSTLPNLRGGEPSGWGHNFLHAAGQPATPFTVLPSLQTPADPLIVTDADWLNLKKKYQQYFHLGLGDGAQVANTGTSDPFKFAAITLGWIDTDPAADHFFYIFPYKISVPVSELLSAPQAVFKWADFGIDPASDIFEIDVYRTAYADNTNFEAQTYGKAGSIKKDGSFTDNIKDTDLVFDNEIRAESGYLKGEFSGKVIRVWNGNIREGDTQTAYQIHKPSSLVQQIYFDWIKDDGTTGGGLVPLADISTLDGDSLAVKNYAYQYADDDGNVSDLAVLPKIGPVSSENKYSGVKGGVGFTFPHGYGSKVTQIFVFEGRYLTTPAAHREYRRIGIIQVTDGHFLFQGLSDVDWANKPIAEDSTPKISHDPGACIWSEAQDMFFFPQINFELEHQFAPVTKIGVTVGPAHIATDQTVNKTDFGIDNRWEEVSSGQDSVGCIGRFCSLELGKAIVFLSAKGLYLAEGSGIRPFPAYVQTVVLKYLNEHISGVAPLANARRAGMGWLGQRNELWLSFPSSVDLGGTLPPITIVYRFFDDFGYFGKKDAGNYRFFLTDTDAVNDVQHQVFYLGSATGKLFAVTFDDRTSAQMLLIDCDNSTESDWKLPGYLTLPMTLGAPHVVKDLVALRFLADAQCKLQSTTGMRRTDGSELPITQGLLRSECTTFDHIIDPAEKFLQPFNHQISESVYDFKDRVPLLRIISKPDDNGNHKCRIKSVEAEFYVPDARNIHSANAELRSYGRWEPIGSQTPFKERE